MDAKQIEPCLMAYGFYPMTLILKHLEKQDRFEECMMISNILKSHKKYISQEDNKIHFVCLKWTKKVKEQYYLHEKEFEKKDKESIKLKINERLFNINDRLELGLNIKKQNQC